VGKNAWWLDDEKVAYPSGKRTSKLGVRTSRPQGPLGIFNEEHCKP
jgi:hypothetical protein